MEDILDELKSTAEGVNTANVLMELARREKIPMRSEEHTSELQSLTNLVCRLLLEKKKKKINNEKLLKNQIELDIATELFILPTHHSTVLQ